MNKKIICQGNCQSHRGQIRKVEVHGFFSYPFKFTYCEEAIDEDTRRGFKVVIIEETKKIESEKSWEEISNYRILENDMCCNCEHEHDGKCTFPDGRNFKYVEPNGICNYYEVVNGGKG